MKVLVTGGAGFIGSHLVENLLRRGNDVVVLDDLSSGQRPNVPSGVEFVLADVSEPAVVDCIASIRPDAILHLAAQVSVTGSMARPDRDLAVNVLGMRHVIEGGAAAGSGRLVFVSSGGAIYGETEGAAEDDQAEPASYYGIHKFVAERYLELSGRSYGIARLANVYGPRQRADLEGGVVAIFAGRLRSGEPIDLFGTGEQSRDFVHVSDVVSALIAMLVAPHNGLWNVGTGRATTINGLLSTMEQAISPATVVRWHDARAGEIFSSVLSIDRIRSDLGWAPAVSLADGVSNL
jgi:UDP-glucose 4-epimerase